MIALFSSGHPILIGHGNNICSWWQEPPTSDVSEVPKILNSIISTVAERTGWKPEPTVGLNWINTSDTRLHWRGLVMIVARSRSPLDYFPIWTKSQARIPR